MTFGDPLRQCEYEIGKLFLDSNFIFGAFQATRKTLPTGTKSNSGRDSSSDRKMRFFTVDSGMLGVKALSYE